MNHPIRLKFTASFPDATSLNQANSGLPEFAFAGKSNVGKSSLLNALAGRKNLVKTSATPGKTRLLNVFSHPAFWLVDLPGFGYAKVSHKQRAEFDKMLRGYFQKSNGLQAVFFLKDSRRDWDAEEEKWLHIISESGRALFIILTKTDKLKQKERSKLVPATCKRLGIERNQCLTTSVLKKQGIDELRELIRQWAGAGDGSGAGES